MRRVACRHVGVHPVGCRIELAQRSLDAQPRIVQRTAGIGLAGRKRGALVGDRRAQGGVYVELPGGQAVALVGQRHLVPGRRVGERLLQRSLRAGLPLTQPRALVGQQRPESGVQVGQGKLVPRALVGQVQLRKQPGNALRELPALAQPLPAVLVPVQDLRRNRRVPHRHAPRRKGRPRRLLRVPLLLGRQASAQRQVRLGLLIQLPQQFRVFHQEGVNRVRPHILHRRRIGRLPVGQRRRHRLRLHRAGHPNLRGNNRARLLNRRQRRTVRRLRHAGHARTRRGRAGNKDRAPHVVLRVPRLRCRVPCRVGAHIAVAYRIPSPAGRQQRITRSRHISPLHFALIQNITALFFPRVSVPVGLVDAVLKLASSEV